MRCALFSVVLWSASKKELLHKATDKHLSHWDAFCVAHNVYPYLKAWADSVPILLVFGELYQGAVGQSHARLGGPGPRKDSHGDVDFRIQRQIKAYTKEDSPHRRVKPMSIIIIVLIMAQSFGNTRTDAEMSIADMIMIAFCLATSAWRIHRHYVQ
jgi:hypothetical protein